MLELVYSGSPSLQPESISLLFLTSLTLKAVQPGELIKAIVAPNLSVPCDWLSAVFHVFESKFRNIQHLVGCAIFYLGSQVCQGCILSVLKHASCGDAHWKRMLSSGRTWMAHVL